MDGPFFTAAPRRLEERAAPHNRQHELSLRPAADGTGWHDGEIQVWIRIAHLVHQLPKSRQLGRAINGRSASKGDSNQEQPNDNRAGDTAHRSPILGKL